jgi:hypothetical protein
MPRPAIIALLLVVFAAPLVIGSPVPPKKTGKGAPAAAASHSSRGKTQPTLSRTAGHATGSATGESAGRGTGPAGARQQQAMTRTASFKGTPVAKQPLLRGSYASLERQNQKLEADGLERIEDDDDLADRIARKMLVPVPASAVLTVNGNLAKSHRYCRPWTARFLADLARLHAARFHRPLEVSSAVRTVEYQKQLMKTNGNAAAAEGGVVSPHLTGATIDIAKNALSRQEIGWMRSWLLPVQKAGKIDVEEEFQQACFHITVYKSYVPPMRTPKAAQTRTAKQRTRQTKPVQRNDSQEQKRAAPSPEPAGNLSKG